MQGAWVPGFPNPPADTAPTHDVPRQKTSGAVASILNQIAGRKKCIQNPTEILSAVLQGTGSTGETIK